MLSRPDDGVHGIPRFGEANVVVPTIACVEPGVDHPLYGKAQTAVFRCDLWSDRSVPVRPSSGRSPAQQRNVDDLDVLVGRRSSAGC
jgi:hypothetical protein